MYMYGMSSIEKKTSFSKVKHDRPVAKQDRVLKIIFQVNTWYEKNDK